jgi:hypothetical protein
MNFAEAIKNESKYTYTENGALALNTTGNNCLDLFGTIGALRNADDSRIERLFADAYSEDPLTATKIVFYARDVRGGLGERQTFRTLLKYMAKYHPESLKKNLDLIGVFGRYDDLYALVGTQLEGDMWAAMKAQLEEDLKCIKENKAVSLLGKWMKSINTSSKESKRLGILTAQKLGYTPSAYRKILSSLRKQIKVTETLMSAGKWNEIQYSEVPSRAMMIYRNAFLKHDQTRFEEFTNKALTGEVKINSSTLYPYDLIEKILHGSWGFKALSNDIVEAQWRQLPNYVEEGTNAIVIADTSGSMSGRPICTAIGLAIYFAERNNGAYHNMWMSFSGDSKIQILRGETLAQKINYLDTNSWGSNTNLEKAFNNILDIAIKNHVSPDEMPKSLIIISDMEIDSCTGSFMFYDSMRAKFAQYGYEIPNIVFWNVASRHDVFHADKTRKGVQLVSGQSATTFKQVMQCIGMTPTEAMHKVIDSERYSCITI